MVAGSLDKYDAFLIAKQPLDKAEELDIDKFLETASVAQALQNMRISNLQVSLNRRCRRCLLFRCLCAHCRFDHLYPKDETLPHDRRPDALRSRFR